MSRGIYITNDRTISPFKKKKLKVLPYPMLSSVYEGGMPFEVSKTWPVLIPVTALCR
jgi:hypothetical protein